MYAMQVRFDRHDMVKRSAENIGDDVLRYGFTRTKHRVLTHVRQIRCNQDHAFRSGTPQRIGRKQGRNQLGIRVVERSHQYRKCARRRFYPHESFTIGKLMDTDGRGSYSE